MIKLHETHINAIDANTEYGFAHIVTSDGLTIQCCLEERADSNGYKKAINASDCGETDGICGDVNEGAFAKYGREESMKALFRELRKIGVSVRNV